MCLKFYYNVSLYCFLITSYLCLFGAAIGTGLRPTPHHRVHDTFRWCGTMCTHAEAVLGTRTKYFGAIQQRFNVDGFIGKEDEETTGGGGGDGGRSGLSGSLSRQPTDQRPIRTKWERDLSYRQFALTWTRTATGGPRSEFNWAWNPKREPSLLINKASRSFPRTTRKVDEGVRFSLRRIK